MAITTPNKLPRRLSRRDTFTYFVLILGVIGSVIAITAIEPEGGVVKGEVPAITYSTDTPDEDPIRKDYAWRGNAGDPKYIDLPTIRTGGFVQKMGVDQRTQIAVPTNINLAGWFADTARPGQPGLSIIDGHVNGRKADGIFKNLKNLKGGDEFTVTLGNGKGLRYRVFGKTSVATKDAPGVLFSQDPTKKSQLNLITCGGAFDTKANSYEQRVIITAELL